MSAVTVRCASVLKQSRVLQRNFGICAPLMAASPTDPIQKLFLDKLKEYSGKSKGGKLVDITPEKQKEYDETLLNIKKQFGADKEADFTKFPTFNFTEPKLDPINMEERS